MNNRLTIRTIIIPILLILAAGFISGLIPENINDAVWGGFKSLEICQTSCDLWGPGSGEIILGFVFLLAAAAVALYSRFQRQTDAFCARHYCKILRVMIGVLIVVSFFMALNKIYAHDEYEHIHCAWYIKHHFIPYRDFFENHHPLLWFTLSPVIFLMQETVYALVLARLFLFFVFLGSLYLIFQITRKISGSVHKSLLALLFLISMELFVFYGIEVRPDSFQLLFMLAGLYTLLKYFESHKARQILLSGGFLSISFLFLQKAAFAILGIFLILLWAVRHRKIPRNSLILFLTAFVIPLLIFISFLAFQHALNDYWISAWLFNKYHFKTSNPQNAMYVAYSLNPHIISRAQTLMNRNNFFWFFSLFACGYLFCQRKFSFETKIIPGLALFIWLPIFFMRNPYGQYFIPAIPLFSMANGIVLADIFEHWNIKAPLRLLLLACMIFIPVLIHSRLAATPLSHGQRAKIQFILDNTDKRDYIYDGDIRFNLFNPDLHYIWYYLSPYGWGKGLTMYNEITNGRFANYDICALIDEKKPKIISRHAVDFKKCGLDDQYLETAFQGIFIRRRP